MIDKPDEHRRMFAVEEQLWWYRHLHDLVVECIQRRFGPDKDLAVFDAGCGTGGMLYRLHQQGYTNLRGVDGSAEGVACCRARGLTVDQLDLNRLETYNPTGRPDDTYDVIICNDVFCYFHDPELRSLLTELGRRLRPGGVLISNNNAFSVFKGEHDLAVGSLRRFVRADFDRVTAETGLRINSSTYWSFFLSPLILLVRQWQALQLRLGWRSAGQPESDVALPHPLINRILYGLVRTEHKLVSSAPFGSSLLLEMEPAGLSVNQLAIPR